ncbi:hypothetical protein [Halanaerobium kushneri]
MDKEIQENPLLERLEDYNSKIRVIILL